MTKPASVRKDLFFAEGPGAIVFAYMEFEDELQAAKAKDAAKIVAILKDHFCEIGRVKDERKWNPNEGTHTIGHKKYRVEAVKSFQARAYGVQGNFHGKRAFFVSAVDPKKKQDKANQQLLKKAAKGAVDLVGKIKGAKL